MTTSNGQTIPRFCVKRREQVIQIEGQDGEVQNFTLRELTGEGRDDFMNIMSRKIVTTNPAAPQVKDHRGTCSALLARTLYDDKGVLVPEQTIQTWPTTMQEELFKLSVKLSALDKKAEEEAKND